MEVKVDWPVMAAVLQAETCYVLLVAGACSNVVCWLFRCRVLASAVWSCLAASPLWHLVYAFATQLCIIKEA